MALNGNLLSLVLHRIGMCVQQIFAHRRLPYIKPLIKWNLFYTSFILEEGTTNRLDEVLPSVLSQCRYKHPFTNFKLSHSAQYASVIFANIGSFLWASELALTTWDSTLPTPYPLSSLSKIFPLLLDTLYWYTIGSLVSGTPFPVTHPIDTPLISW